MSRPIHNRPDDHVPVRPPAVAGRFYPGQSGELSILVDTLLAEGARPTDAALGDSLLAGTVPASAFVVPHAGYPYSGPTAAVAYAWLRRHAEGIQRVVLLGPAHYVPLSGCAAPAARRWATPLGEVRIDREAIHLLADEGYVGIDDRPHAPEHSLEVQLPFLQRVLPAAIPVVPILVGASPADDVAAVVAAATRPATVVLCSTDLSHYLDQPTALARDERTARAVLELADDRIGTGDACGVFALRGLLTWARGAGLTAALLHRCTSADSTGDTSRVVGYASFAFVPPPR